MGNAVVVAVVHAVGVRRLARAGRAAALGLGGEAGTGDADERNQGDGDLGGFLHGGMPFRFGSGWDTQQRSEEHTSELQSLMRISYAVFCLKKTTHAELRS